MEPLEYYKAWMLTFQFAQEGQGYTFFEIRVFPSYSYLLLFPRSISVVLSLSCEYRMKEDFREDIHELSLPMMTMSATYTTRRIMPVVDCL